jgi:CheY-like chemotaxis protein
MQARQMRRTTLNPPIAWLVEDDSEDAKLVAKVLQETSPEVCWVHWADAEQARECLQSQPGKWPCLILLALNGTSERASRLLQTIKTDEALRLIPVVALAQSRDEHEVSAAYALGLAGYVTKSKDRARLREEMAIVGAYWTVSLTPRVFGGQGHAQRSDMHELQEGTGPRPGDEGIPRSDREQE